MVGRDLLPHQVGHWFLVGLQRRSRRSLHTTSVHFPPITVLHRASTCRCLYFGTSTTFLYFQCGYLVAYGAYTYSAVSLCICFRTSFALHIRYTYAHHHINIKFYVTAAKESQKLHWVHGTTLQNGLSNSIQQRRNKWLVPPPPSVKIIRSAVMCKQHFDSCAHNCENSFEQELGTVVNIMIVVYILVIWIHFQCLFPLLNVNIERWLVIS